MKKDNPRFLALLVLNEVLLKWKKPKESIEEKGNRIERRDRALLYELVYGVLRNLLYLDWRLHPYLKRPEDLRKSTLNNLRLGTYQALLMRVPNWASVNETVEVERASGQNAPLVNAVLRKLVENGSCPSLLEDPIQRLSISTSHPEWLVRRWIDRFGINEAESLLRANNKMPPLTLRVNTLQTDRENIAKGLRQKGIGYTYTNVSPVGVKITSHYIFSDIKEMLGDVFIQDEAAQLIPYLLQPEKGMLILDACAAPGGKTTHIAELTEDMAKIYAVDRSHKRIERLKENIKRHRLHSVKAIHADLEEFRTKQKFHRILLDAPCSSLGVCRRNPDVKYRYKLVDMKTFQGKQVELLLKASTFLLPDGLILYTVCSHEPEESGEVIERFLHKRNDYFIINIKTVKPLSIMKKLKRFITKEGYFLTLPQRDDMDGFFAAILSRR